MIEFAEAESVAAINACSSVAPCAFASEKPEPNDGTKLDQYKRMAMLDECKNLPLNTVWDYLCWKKGAGVGMSWLDEMDRYEREVQFARK